MSSVANQERWLNVHELAEMLNLSERTIWRLVSSNVIPKPLHVGKNARWAPSVVETWVRQLKGQAACN